MIRAKLAVGLSIVVVIVIIVLVAGRRTDDSGKVDKLPDLAQQHGMLVSVSFSGQNQTIRIIDSVSCTIVRNAAINSEIGNKSRENQFFSYRTGLVFSDGYSMEFDTSVAVSSRQIIFMNDARKRGHKPLLLVICRIIRIMAGKADSHRADSRIAS